MDGGGRRGKETSETRDAVLEHRSLETASALTLFASRAGVKDCAGAALHELALSRCAALRSCSFETSATTPSTPPTRFASRGTRRDARKTRTTRARGEDGQRRGVGRGRVSSRRLSFGDGAEVTDHAVAAGADAALDAETRAARNRLAVERVADVAALAALAAATDFDADVSFRAATETKTRDGRQARRSGTGRAASVSAACQRTSRRSTRRARASSRRGTAPSPTRAPPSNDTPRRSRVVSRRRPSRRIGARDGRRRPPRGGERRERRRRRMEPEARRRRGEIGDGGCAETRSGRTRHVGGVRRRAGEADRIGSRRNSIRFAPPRPSQKNAEAARLVARIGGGERTFESLRLPRRSRTRRKTKTKTKTKTGLRARCSSRYEPARSAVTPATVRVSLRRRCCRSPPNRPGGFAALKRNPPGGVVVFRRGGIFETLGDDAESLGGGLEDEEDENPGRDEDEDEDEDVGSVPTFASPSSVANTFGGGGGGGGGGGYVFVRFRRRRVSASR